MIVLLILLAYVLGILTIPAIAIFLDLRRIGEDI